MGHTHESSLWEVNFDDSKSWERFLFVDRLGESYFYVRTQCGAMPNFSPLTGDPQQVLNIKPISSIVGFEST